ncbi:synaptotagmin-15 [Halyomorpha halys]|uniref:synaptotagmin-15 n=1 Tax=Halyomorpha halys TaxID=286706 RepID=UPI000D0C8893|nr:synaptotagmin-15-like [Halyomorpha halys]
MKKSDGGPVKVGETEDVIFGFPVSLQLIVAVAGALMMVLGMAAACLVLRRRRNPEEEDSLAPHILVYPSYQGDSVPQLISKQIDFSLPQMRKTESLDDIIPDEDDEEDCKKRQEQRTSGGPTQQRSNSFSSYGALGGLNPALYRNPGELEEELHYPEGHLGRLWFYLRYEVGCEKLLITLLKIKNLPSRTVGTANACDPIVRLHLIPNERRTQQSRQKKKTCNPFFDETFVFQVSEKELADHSLRMTVLDTGRNKKSNVIGHVTFPLRHLATEHPTDQLELLKMDLEKESDGPLSDLGELLVSLLYNENLHRLTVSVMAARNLKLQEGCKDETFVRLTLNQHWNTVKVKRTSVVRCSTDPQYSQGFNFRVSSANVDVTSLSLQVLQSPVGYGKDKLIGKCVLGSYMFARGKALTHWNSAFANPMEQIQNWHPLSE